MHAKVKKPKWTTPELAEVAVFAALTAILAQLAIPLPNGVPMTLQTFAVALVGYTLGKDKGTLAMVVYLLLGAVGLPVFANFRGGAMVLFGVTGGFLWGFVLLAFLCGYSVGKRPWFQLGYGCLGFVSAHVLGVLQFSLVSGTSLLPAFMAVSFPFLLKDLISVGLAMLLAKRLRRLHPFQ